jgi:hypothetical protein
MERTIPRTTADMLNGFGERTENLSDSYIQRVTDAGEVLGLYSPWAQILYRYGKYGKPESGRSRNLQGEKISAYKSRVNREILGAISEIHGISMERASSVYYESLKDANALVSLILRETLPREYVNIFGLRNEVSSFSNNPADHIWRLAHSSRDEAERYQIFRQLQLANMFFELNSNYPNEVIHQYMYLLHELFNESLYQAGEGFRGNQYLSVTHYCGEYNEFLSFHDDFGGQETKGIYSVRTIHNGKDDIHILTNNRIKGKAEAGGKALQKSTRSNVIEINEHVRDLAGIRFTVIGDTGQRDYLYQRITDVLNKAQYGTNSIISRFEDDSVVDGRSTNGGIDWKRIKVYLKDKDGKEISQPIELIVDDFEVFSNGLYYFGSANSSRKPRAHEIYKTERSQAIFPYLFPKDIYYDAYAAVHIPMAMEQHKANIIDNLRRRV